MKRFLTAFSCFFALSLSAQTECDNPDVNCDGNVNVTDLLEMLIYFGDEEDGPWLEGDDCYSPDLNCDGLVNLNDVLGMLTSFGEIVGCTDSEALNYDSEATIDDGSCIIPGCIFPNACNYNPVATEDDGSCIFSCPGCTDEMACNYDSEALQDDGSCEYPVDLYGVDYVDCTGACLNDEDGDGICIEDEVHGCSDSEACNYDIEVTEDDGSCEYDSCTGCMEEGACNFDPGAIFEDGACEYESCAGCMYEFACNYDPEATIEDNETCEFGTCPGCTDIEACNYNPTVTEDDGSCVYSGDTGFDCEGNCLLPWTQQGEDIDGETLQKSGRSVSLSSDGSTLAIGAPYSDGTINASGLVRIYTWNGSSWVQQGEDIDGEAGGDNSGYFLSSISLSSDGAMVAIGTGLNDGNDSNSGHVRIYTWNGSSWVQQGEDIDGEAQNDYSGYSVSLSSDGNTVAIGAPNNDGNGNNSGHVRIYTWNGSSWVQQGEDIDGEAQNDRSGSSVSLSSDGNTVAIGAPENDGNGDLINQNSGHVRIYTWNGSSWVQQGEDIDGEAGGDDSGWSISLSSNGNKVAIGAWQNDGNGNLSGHVRIYTEGCE